MLNCVSILRMLSKKTTKKNNCCCTDWTSIHCINTCVSACIALCSLVPRLHSPAFLVLCRKTGYTVREKHVSGVWEQGKHYVDGIADTQVAIKKICNKTVHELVTHRVNTDMQTLIDFQVHVMQVLHVYNIPCSLYYFHNKFSFVGVMHRPNIGIRPYSSIE